MRIAHLVFIALLGSTQAMAQTGGPSFASQKAGMEKFMKEAITQAKVWRECLVSPATEMAKPKCEAARKAAIVEIDQKQKNFAATLECLPKSNDMVALQTCQSQKVRASGK